MPGYKVLFRGRANRQLQRISPPHFKRVRIKIRQLADNPRPPGVKRLVNSRAYRIKVGDYRVLYEIDDAQNLVIVYRVGHRRDVYR